MSDVHIANLIESATFYAKKPAPLRKHYFAMWSPRQSLTTSNNTLTALSASKLAEQLTKQVETKLEQHNNGTLDDFIKNAEHRYENFCTQLNISEWEVWKSLNNGKLVAITKVNKLNITYAYYNDSGQGIGNDKGPVSVDWFIENFKRVHQST